MRGDERSPWRPPPSRPSPRPRARWRKELTPKAQILVLIPKLATADLAEVQTALKFASSLTKAAPIENDSDWLLAGIAAYFVRRGLLVDKGASAALRRRDSFRGYAAKREALSPFLDRLEASASTHTRHRGRLALVLADALADWLESRRMLSISAMLQNIDKLPEAIEDSYPGYVQAGLFGMILRMEAVR